jgi:hypothetical protein
MELIRDFDRQEGPIAYLRSSLMDGGAFAAADIGIAVSDGSYALPIEMADIVLPAKRLDRLVDCVAVAEDIGANNRQNFYLVLLPHSAALLLSVLLLLDPLLAILLADVPLVMLADVPLVMVEINNLQTFNHLRQEHKLGWKAQRKRTSKCLRSTLAPDGNSRKQNPGKALLRRRKPTRICFAVPTIYSCNFPCSSRKHYIKNHRRVQLDHTLFRFQPSLDSP